MPVFPVFRTYIPAAPLSAYVDFFWLHEDDALERALPTGKSALWIELGGDGLQVAARQDAQTHH